MRLDECKTKCEACFWRNLGRCEAEKADCISWSPDEEKLNYFLYYIDRDSDEHEISRNGRFYSLQEAIDALSKDEDMKEGMSGEIEELSPDGEHICSYYEDGEPKE